MPLSMPRSRVKALSPWGISVLAHAALVAMIFGSSKRAVSDAAPAPLPIAVQVAVAPQPQTAPAHVTPTPPAPPTPPKPRRAPVAPPRQVDPAAPAPARRVLKHASPAPGDAAPTPTPAAPAAPAAAAAPSAPSTLAAAPTAAPAPAQESLTPPIGNAAYLHNPAPKYPPSALEDGLEGRVVLRVHVDANGHPISVEVRTGTGHDILDKAALAAVRRWTFVPAKRGATPVDGWVDIPLEFHAN
jgi:protein TonB